MRETDEQREEQERRRFRAAMGLLQIGGLGFLAMIVAGLAPRLLARWFPSLGAGWTTVAIGTLAALVAVALAVVRLSKMMRDARPPPGPGGGEGSPPA